MSYMLCPKMRFSTVLTLVLYHLRCSYLFVNADLVKGAPALRSVGRNIDIEKKSTGGFTNQLSRLQKSSSGNSIPVQSPDAVLISETGKDLSKTSSTISTKKIVTVALPLITVVFLYKQFNQFIPSIDELKSQLLVVLGGVNEKGFVGVLYYILGFALYETAGFSTVPVETIAGMAFGFKKGALSSATGKLLGALFAFTLGRTVLRPTIKSKMNNDIFLSISHSVSRHQLKNALFLKFSIFPEIIKNFSMAVMDVSYQVFVLVTVIHGLPYTLLWNWLGHDSAMRLKSIEAIPPNYILNSLLLAVTIFGIVGSPALFAFWLRSLQKDVAKSD